jgi:dTDP-glucose 4,6-dehydratase
MSTILVTGGAGFIGSNLLLSSVPRSPQRRFVNVDKIGYASNLIGFEAIDGAENYAFAKCDLADREAVDEVFARHRPDHVIHLAAETHVDRSIEDPGSFVQSNVIGTFNLLEACRRAFAGKRDAIFLHVSTDEVFGSLGAEGRFDETSPVDPSSPYSASKAASDHLVRAYHRTYGLPVKITICSNNYGPRQFPEKLIPSTIKKALANEPLPVYGRGENVRDWIYVDDHVEGIWRVFGRGKIGQSYAIGARSEARNIDVVHAICDAVARVTSVDAKALAKLVTFVPDRPGHDHRYALDPSRIERELDFSARESFASGLEKTVRFYVANPNFGSGR